MRRLYTLVLYLMLPFALLRLLWRARRQPGYVRHVAERLGYYAAAPEAPLIWLHAVSVGETRAAEPLVRALQARHPQCRILLTHMTPTGRETGETLFGGRVERCYLPYDFPGGQAGSVLAADVADWFVFISAAMPATMTSARTTVSRRGFIFAVRVTSRRDYSSHSRT